MIGYLRIDNVQLSIDGQSVVFGGSVLFDDTGLRVDSMLSVPKSQLPLSPGGLSALALQAVTDIIQVQGLKQQAPEQVLVSGGFV